MGRAKFDAGSPPLVPGDGFPRFSATCLEPAVRHCIRHRSAGFFMLSGLHQGPRQTGGVVQRRLLETQIGHALSQRRDDVRSSTEQPVGQNPRRDSGTKARRLVCEGWGRRALAARVKQQSDACIIWTENKTGARSIATQPNAGIGAVLRDELDASGFHCRSHLLSADSTHPKSVC